MFSGGTLKVKQMTIIDINAAAISHSQRPFELAIGLDAANGFFGGIDQKIMITILENAASGSQILMKRKGALF